MNDPSPRVYKEVLRLDLGYFAQRCFCELNPQAAFLPNWHIEVIAAKLAAVRAGRIRRLIINLPPRHLKSLLASIAFPAWCLGHDPSAQILCVSACFSAPLPACMMPPPSSTAVANYEAPTPARPIFP